jgi:hypothetical protein
MKLNSPLLAIILGVLHFNRCSFQLFTSYMNVYGLRITNQAEAYKHRTGLNQMSYYAFYLWADSVSKPKPKVNISSHQTRSNWRIGDVPSSKCERFL